MNIPIYRAKKIDSDKYIQGYLLGMWGEYFISWGETNHVPNKVQVDPLTLAVHFKDMVDSEGNKIFASLSEDGKGGDYTNCEKLPVIFCWDSLNACVCLKGKYEYTALFKDGSTNSKNTTFNKYTIIGIQE